MIGNKQTVYLVNNKKKEPDFEDSFKRISKAKKIKYRNISSLDCAFSYTRKSNKCDLFISGKKVDITNSNWFIRAWSPSEDASALLAVFLEMHKIPFTDIKVNSSHEIRTSKLSQTFQLTAKDCACPSTWVIPIVNFNQFESKATKSLGFPVIIKARGGLGQRVWKCESKSELKKRVDLLKKEGEDDLVILQENIDNQGDIRVVVFQNKVLTSIGRYSSTGFLNNVSQGGTAELIKITPEEKKLAIKSAKAVGLELAGVDIVRSKYGPLIFEVNKAPDITSFNEAAGFKIQDEIITSYLNSII